MDYKEVIERLEYLKVKAEIALSNSNTSSEWLKEDVKGTITAFTMAIEAVEKQIPKKPIYTFIDGFTKSVPYYCPVCGEQIAKYDVHARCILKEHHCKCGQRIDFSEVEYE